VSVRVVNEWRPVPEGYSIQGQIKTALDALVTRAAAAPDPDPTEHPADVIAEHLLGNRLSPFVVIRDRTTGKFVQFAGHKSEPLVLDLPLEALTAQEKKRARAFFSQYGVHVPEVGQLFDISTGEPIETIRSYKVSFGRAIDLAVQFALEVFRIVYRLPSNLELILDEH
jgi:hypothetical protein